MVWRNAAWRNRALRWAERQLAEQDIHIQGKPEQFHVRTWSTVIRLPTDKGAMFFKAVWPPLRFEAGLTAAIAWITVALAVPGRPSYHSQDVGPPGHPRDCCCSSAGRAPPW